MNIPDDIKSAFPVTIDCGMRPPEVAPAGSRTTKTQKPIYPSLYLSDCDNIDQVPAEGYALVYFKRRRTTTTEDDSGPSKSVDLEVQEISLPAMSGDQEMGELGDAMAGMAKERGILPKDDAEEEAAETPETEAAEDEEEEED